MTVRESSIRDWNYLEARRRLLDAGRAQLPLHTANARLDEAANRVVECSCGWTGNMLGWAGHVDQVVTAALDD
jgi:hypothetical protein